MKALLTISFILMANFAIASEDVNPSEVIQEDEMVEVGDVKTSTCSAQVAMGDTSEVEVGSGASGDVVKPNSSRQ